MVLSQPGGEVLDREFMYSIGDAAQLLEIHPQTLRLYDKEGLLLPARQRQWRFYTPHDVARVNAMRHLIHDAGMSLKGLCRLLGLIPCWDIMGCSTRRKNSCPRAAVRSQPCWSVDGNERSKCRSCRVYLGAVEYVCDQDEAASFFDGYANPAARSARKRRTSTRVAVVP